MEAATALGSTRWQVLRKVRLPMARPTIVLAVNQTIMMALSMVVVTALIDAPGLGENIICALERVNVGAAFDAGLAIVILAIVLDRITTAARRAEPATGSAGGGCAGRLAVAAVVALVAGSSGRRRVPGAARGSRSPGRSTRSTGGSRLHWYDVDRGPEERRQRGPAQPARGPC